MTVFRYLPHQVQDETAQDLKKFGVIDEIIPEPTGGAHRDAPQTIERVGEAIHRHLKELMPLSGEKLKAERTEKFLAMGREQAHPERRY